MTREDLVGGNEGMVNFCGSLLVEHERTLLQVKATGPVGRSLRLTTQGLDRLDFYIDERPGGWLPVTDGTSRRKLPTDWGQVEVRGFIGRRLKQRRVINRN